MVPWSDAAASRRGASAGGEKARQVTVAGVVPLRNSSGLPSWRTWQGRDCTHSFALGEEAVSFVPQQQAKGSRRACGICHTAHSHSIARPPSSYRVDSDDSALLGGGGQQLPLIVPCHHRLRGVRWQGSNVRVCRNGTRCTPATLRRQPLIHGRSTARRGDHTCPSHPANSPLAPCVLPARTARPPRRLLPRLLRRRRLVPRHTPAQPRPRQAGPAGRQARGRG